MSIKTNHLLSEGACFHVYNRGVNRGKIFIETRIYRYVVDRMHKYNDPGSMEIIAYCLMPNHFHFLVRQYIPLGTTKFFKGVCGGYVRAINNDYEKSGHLFEGKFKIKPVDSVNYLLHLSRYIHLNPVRAGMVAVPEDWEFSSCRAYFGMDETTLVQPEMVHREAGGMEGYKRFVKEYIVNERKRIERFLF